MPRIVISDECHDLIVSKARTEWMETGTRLPEGTWSVPVSQEIINGLRSHQMAGERLSDVIMRIIAQADGLN